MGALMKFKILLLAVGLVVFAASRAGAQSLPLDANGNVKTSIQQNTPPTDVSATGSITGASQTVVLTLSGQGTCVAQIANSFTGTAAFQVSPDNGVTWQPLYMTPNGGGTAVSTASAAGMWTAPCSGMTKFEITSTAWTSGTAAVALRGGTPPSPASQVTATVSNFPSQQTVNGTVTVTQSSGSNLQMTCASGCAGNAWSYYSVPASTSCVSPAVCVIGSPARTLAAIINLSTSAQSAGNCTVYDNASAASGQVVYIENGIGPGQIITFSTNGLKLTNGLVLQCAVAPTGSGLLVLYQ